MAYSIVSFNAADLNAIGSSPVSAPNFTVGAGNAVVVYVQATSEASRTISIDNSASADNDTWTQAGSTVYDGGTALLHALFYIANATAGSLTVRASFSGSVYYPSIAVVELSGIATSSALAGSAMAIQSAPGTGTDGVTTGNTGTLTGQPAAVIGFAFNNGRPATNVAVGTGYTDVGTGWSQEGTNNEALRVEHKRVTATSAVAATFTAATNQAHTSAVIALLESGGGGGTPGAVFSYHYGQQGIQ